MSNVNLSRIYRAHIEPVGPHGIERTAFVEAASHQDACKKIAAVIAALEHRHPFEVAGRVYNCHSATEVIDEGMSDDPEARLFETGWDGGRAISFVRHPLFLVDDSAELCRKWAAITAPDDWNCTAATALTGQENY